MVLFVSMKAKTNFLRCIGYLSFTKDHTKLDLLQILALVLKCRGFRATSLSTYDFSTLYTTLPHNLIKKKLLDLIEWTFKRALKNYGSLYLACNDRKAIFTSSDKSRYTLWSCQNVCDALSYLLDNIYIRFGTKLYRQIVGIPMGTNCAPLVADLFLNK